MCGTLLFDTLDRRSSLEVEVPWIPSQQKQGGAMSPVEVPVLEKVWVDSVRYALREMVAMRFQQHHPRFKGVTISVTLSSPHSFSVCMVGKEKPFDEEGRAIVRSFFTTDLKERAEYICREYLRWGLVRVHTHRCDHSLTRCEWFVTCRDEAVAGKMLVPRHRRKSSLNRTCAP